MRALPASAWGLRGTSGGRRQAIPNATLAGLQRQGERYGTQKRKRGLEFLEFFKEILGSSMLVSVTHLKQTSCIVLIIIHKVWPEVTFHCFQTSSVLKICRPLQKSKRMNYRLQRQFEKKFYSMAAYLYYGINSWSIHFKGTLFSKQQEAC